jgi:hypothetical protein
MPGLIQPRRRAVVSVLIAASAALALALSTETNNPATARAAGFDHISPSMPTSRRYRASVARHAQGSMSP